MILSSVHRIPGECCVCLQFSGQLQGLQRLQSLPSQSQQRSQQQGLPNPQLDRFEPAPFVDALLPRLSKLSRSCAEVNYDETDQGQDIEGCIDGQL